MSSPPRSGDRSRPPEGGAAADPVPSELSLASLVRHRGAELIDALEERSPGAREHAEATGTYAFATAVELGYDRSHSELLREAAKLHEVGKIYLARELLAKDRAALDAAARAQLDAHHDAGYRLARGAGIPEQVCRWVLRMRERFDGAGAEQLAGARIPVESRIIRAACLCHEALSRGATGGNHPPRGRWTSVASELRSRSGEELDPEVVEALVAVLDAAPGTGD